MALLPTDVVEGNRFRKAREFFSPDPRMVPEEGWRSLRWLPKDLMAGVVMTPVSYVFALSISVIALMSPMSGIFAGILGCILIYICKGTNLGIPGPAAALAPILAAAIMALGMGDIAMGQLLVLPVICCAGALMCFVAYMKWARFTHLVSPAVVEGSILAYIGYSIVVRQIPNFFGTQFSAHCLWDIVTEIPSRLEQLNGTIMSIGVASLAIIIVHAITLEKFKGDRKQQEKLMEMDIPASSFEKTLEMFPGQLIATGVAVYLGYSLILGKGSLVQLPEQITFDITLCYAGFALLLSRPDLWLKFTKYVALLFVVDGVETSSTGFAVDQKDPHRRLSDPNKALMAMGAANLLGSQAGNQSHIIGGMKSGTNIAVGAQTRNATLITGILMLICICFSTTRDVLNHIPLVALSAVIGYAGYRLCAPGVWKHFWHFGRDPGIVFTAGFLISVISGEILLGFVSAIVIEFTLTYRRVYESAKHHEHAGLDTSFGAIVRSIFRNPVVSADVVDGIHVIVVNGPLTPQNRRFYPVCPAGVEDIFVDAEHHEVTYVDYSWLVQCQKDRQGCCGKEHFKLHGFETVSPWGKAPGLRRTVRAGTRDLLGQEA